MTIVQPQKLENKIKHHKSSYGPIPTLLKGVQVIGPTSWSKQSRYVPLSAESRRPLMQGRHEMCKTIYQLRAHRTNATTVRMGNHRPSWQIQKQIYFGFLQPTPYGSFQKQGASIWTPIYYDPYYRTPKRGPRNFWKLPYRSIRTQILRGLSLSDLPEGLR